MSRIASTGHFRRTHEQSSCVLDIGIASDAEGKKFAHSPVQ